jgi:predicted house-cleaning noncanonical NTP pyrophosphatase (MazG superfamily)
MIPKLTKAGRNLKKIRETLPKLVRDKVPEHIISDSLVPVYHFAGDEEYESFLKLKLREEVNELIDGFDEFVKGDFSEVADVLDVVNAIVMHAHSVHIGGLTVANARKAKAQNKGSFGKRIILEGFLDRSKIDEDH